LTHNAAIGPPQGHEIADGPEGGKIKETVLRHLAFRGRQRRFLIGTDQGLGKPERHTNTREVTGSI
jgi:hypothetical protein